MSEYSEWSEVLHDKKLVKQLWGKKYLSLKSKYNYIQEDKKLREKTLVENMISYLEKKGWPKGKGCIYSAP